MNVNININSGYIIYIYNQSSFVNKEFIVYDIETLKKDEEKEKKNQIYKR